MLIQSWVDVTTDAFQALWQELILFIPNLVGAIIILLVGWLVAVGLAHLTFKLANTLKLDQLLEKLGLGKALEKAGWKLSSGKFFAFIVKWFIIIVFLVAAADVLRLPQVGLFLRGIIDYIPSIAAAVIILLMAFWAAEVLQKLVQAAVSATEMKASKFLGALTKWAILIFGFLAALNQLGIAASLIQSLITGLVAMLAIAGGLAFGLGGKDAASRWLDKLSREVSE